MCSIYACAYFQFVLKDFAFIYFMFYHLFIWRYVLKNNNCFQVTIEFMNILSRCSCKHYTNLILLIRFGHFGPYHFVPDSTLWPYFGKDTSTPLQDTSFAREKTLWAQGPKCLHEGPMCLDEGPKWLFQKGPEWKGS